MQDTTPVKLTPELLAFCAKIAPGRPRFIKSRPAADAQPSACFDNVAAKIARAGGGIVHGWAIWHMRRAYFEAEHHGVWLNKQNELVDVSPQLSGGRRILFLPDPSAVYDPDSIRSNVIEAEGEDPLAKEFVSLSRRRYALLHPYRAGGARIVELSRADQAELSVIERTLRELWPSVSARG